MFVKNIFFKKKLIENPYVKGAIGKKIWNNRYLNMKNSILYWRVAFFFSMLIVFFLLFIVKNITNQSKIQPVIIETNHGFPYAILPVKVKASLEDSRVINYIFNQFIINSRTVIADQDAQKTLLDKVYAYAADDALNVLKDYYFKHNPFNDSKNYTVSVQIINAMKLSDHTWQITWDEISSPIIGSALPKTTRWMANLSYRFSKVNEDMINENPFGFYVTNIYWSQSFIGKDSSI